MENKFSSKIILSIVIGLVVFIIASGLVLLNSSAIANNSFALKTRNYYYLNLLPKAGLDQRKLTYTIFPMQKDSKWGYYTYTLLGKFEKSDFPNHLIYLKDKNDQTYAINYLLKSSVNKPNLTFFTYQDILNQKTPVDNNIVFDSDKPEETVSRFVAGDVIEIQWQDFRTLKQILTRGKTSNEILIERGEVLSGVTQVINRYLYDD